MVNGVITRKLNVLDRTIDELDSLRPVSVRSFEQSWMMRRAVERDLQILSEIVVDVCQRVISLLGESPAASGVEAVERCVAVGAISATDSYVKMVGMRNIIVHRYDAVDPAILCEVVNNRLDDYRAFRDDVLRFAFRHEDGTEERQ